MGLPWSHRRFMKASFSWVRSRSVSSGTQSVKTTLEIVGFYKALHASCWFFGSWRDHTCYEQQLLQQCWLTNHRSKDPSLKEKGVFLVDKFSFLTLNKREKMEMVEACKRRGSIYKWGSWERLHLHGFLTYLDAHTWQKINVRRCALEEEESGKSLFNLCGYYYFGSSMVS